MSDIKRYDNLQGEIYETEDGFYIEYDDHIATLTHLLEQVEGMKSTYDERSDDGVKQINVIEDICDLIRSMMKKGGKE